MGQLIHFEDEQRSVLDECVGRSGMSEASARNRLAAFGFTDISVYKRLEVLSGGERSRLELCLILDQQPDLLILDEPTNHLDIRSREILERALRDYEGTVLAVSHDRYFIAALDAEVWGFSAGAVRAYASFDCYREAARVHERAVLEAELEAQAQAEAAQRAAQPAEEARSQRASRPRSADERRARARLQQAYRETSAELERVTRELRALEAGTQPDSPLEHYEALGALAERHDALETRYLELSIALEEDAVEG